MKKSLILSTLVIFGLALYVYFDASKNVVSDNTLKPLIEHQSANIKVKTTEKKIKNLSLKVDSLRKEEVSPDDFSVSYLVKEKGAIGAYYKDLKDGFFERMNKKVPVEDLIGDTTKQVEIFVHDDKKNPIANAEVFLWGYFIGITNGEGYLKKTVPTSDAMSSWIISATKKGYMRGTQTKSILYEKGSLIELSLALKKATSFPIKSIGKKSVIDFVDNTVKINAEGECLLKNALGKCYKGEAKGYLTFVKPSDLGNMGLPMQAVVDDKLIPLISGGMGFTQFTDNQGNVLEWNSENKMKECYILTADQLAAWKDNPWGYRYIDQKTGLWQEDKNAPMTISGNQVCFETLHVY